MTYFAGCSHEAAALPGRWDGPTQPARHGRSDVRGFRRSFAQQVLLSPPAGETSRRRVSWPRTSSRSSSSRRNSGGKRSSISGNRSPGIVKRPWGSIRKCWSALEVCPWASWEPIRTTGDERQRRELAFALPGCRAKKDSSSDVLSRLRLEIGGTSHERLGEIPGKSCRETTLANSSHWSARDSGRQGRLWSDFCTAPDVNRPHLPPVSVRVD